MAVSGIATTPTAAPATTSSATAMSSTDFMKVMLQQLEHQDPLNPTDSNQLLTQLSEISQLQSNTDMQNNIASLTLQQSMGAAGNLIGKQVQGITPSGQATTGTVTKVQITNQQVSLQLDNGASLPMQNVTIIAQPTPTATSANGATTTSSQSAAQQLLQLLQGMAGGSSS
ncbi:MAG TPA: flagellar hook capping FlgD N-terminal domain-containing protein [Phycisphaerae bacterium]|jgi:flagellar basal-body rod modification protein FlgD|nr:flagellar hook capping FlgD N-terminal domain-containing protein [Phycisphaerae bacterium]